jgi:hypothetical protein
MKDIIHQYFKKEFETFKVLVQVNPESFRGTELIIHSTGEIEKTKRVFDPDIFEDLAADEFKEGSPLEFNLYLKGLVE